MKNKLTGNLLFNLVEKLPEIYQPIFGHPELSKVVSRECEDRLKSIIQIYQALEVQLNRPLRVLDLGCAQGFFSFSLARLGAKVYGVDSSESNIAVCQALMKEHPKSKICFKTGRVEDVLSQLAPEQYDLVLGLSVLHHIVYETGIADVQQILVELASKVDIGIFELALDMEPLYWGPSQPQNPRLLFKGFVFVHELARYKTHLSDITRPMYITSNHYWFLNGQMGRFDTNQVDSHAFSCGVHQMTRRYLFGEGYVVKLFLLDCEALIKPNLKEYNNETLFLLNPPPGFDSPQLLLHGRSEHEAWLVRKKLSGELLADIICSGKQYDARLILQDVLIQLKTLEATGLYHSDVRAWNILISDDGKARLIDYGAISKNKNDCVWPHDIFFAFFIFVYEVSTGQIEFPDPVRTVAISPCQLKEPYRNWLFSFWSTPIDQWSFKLLLELFMQIDSLQENRQVVESTLQRYWMSAIEEAVNAQISFARHIQEQQLRIKIESKNIWVEKERLQDELTTAKAKINELNYSSHHWWTVSEQLNQKLQSVYTSKSWRITWPLRKIMTVVRRMIKFLKSML